MSRLTYHVWREERERVATREQRKVQRQHRRLERYMKLRDFLLRFNIVLFPPPAGFHHDGSPGLGRDDIPAVLAQPDYHDTYVARR